MTNQYYTEISFIPSARKPLPAYRQHIINLMKRQPDDDLNNEGDEYNLTFTFKDKEALRRAIHRVRVSRINVKIHTCHEFESEQVPYTKSFIEKLSNRDENSFARTFIKRRLAKAGLMVAGFEKY